MKKTLLFATLLIGGFATAYASDQYTNTTISTPVPVPIDKDLKTDWGRPKAPSKQHIECWYCDGELSFDFVIPEGECTLYLTDYSIKTNIFLILADICHYDVIKHILIKQ